MGRAQASPTLAESLVWSSLIQTATRKSEQFSYLVGTVVSHIQTTMRNPERKQTQFTDTSYSIGTIVHDAYNNDCSLLTFQYNCYGCLCPGK